MKRNPSFERLQGSYVFPEILRRVASFKSRTPDAHLISLGIGDTTSPLPKPVVEAMEEYVRRLGGASYSGYGPEQGWTSLRKRIAEKIYSGRFDWDEIFISDGANCDLGRLAVLFGGHPRIAVQDPVYPVTVHTATILGMDVQTLSCTPENGFFPEMPEGERFDLISICSPNNPTGTVATHTQLQGLVDYARENRSIILFDAAYAPFVRGDSLPRSIFEVEGADEAAIEMGSFSKLAGFTGVRLGWTVVPKKLRYDGGKRLVDDWVSVTNAFFNGPSNIAQAGGMAVLSDKGWTSVQGLVDGYMENTQLLREAFPGKCYGGEHAPYIWCAYPERDSWELFDQFLNEKHLVITPGAGFGVGGEGYVRLSAFAPREQILEAARRIR